MSNDVLKAYNKLMEQKKKQAAQESAALKKYKNSDRPRVGSDDKETIEKLYNLKPEGYKYDKNLAEVAHPDKVILFKSHDKINSLIENENERQTIDLNIFNRHPTGQLAAHKYASELVMSLTRVANDLDNRSQDELRALADICLSQFHNKIVKQAFDWEDLKNLFKGKGSDAGDILEGGAIGAGAGAIIGGLIGAFGGPPGVAAGAIGGAAIGAAVSAIFKTGPEAKNVHINAEKAISALEKMMAHRDEDKFLLKLKETLQHLMTTTDQYGKLIDEAQEPSFDDSKKEQAKEYGTFYQQMINQTDKMIDLFLQNAQEGKYEEKEGDIWGKLKLPFKALVGDTVSDTVRAMETLEVVNNQALKGILAAREKMTQLKQESFKPYTPPVKTEKPILDPEELKKYEDVLKELLPK